LILKIVFKKFHGRIVAHGLGGSNDFSFDLQNFFYHKVTNLPEGRQGARRKMKKLCFGFPGHF